MFVMPVFSIKRGLEGVYTEQRELLQIHKVQEMLNQDVDIQLFSWAFDSSLYYLFPSIQFLQLYVDGESLDALCPPSISEDWEGVKAKMNACKQAMRYASVDVSHGVHALVPTHIVKQYYYYLFLVLEEVKQAYEKPKEYDFLIELSKVLSSIAVQEIEIIEEIPERYRRSRSVNYTFFKKKTRRLGTRRGSFDINIPKKYRNAIGCKNDFLMELDYNAIDLRVFLALAGTKQPLEDPHELNRAFIFNGEVDRDTSKKLFFSWLYGSNSEQLIPYIKRLEAIYKKQQVLEKHYDFLTNTITTFFGDRIKGIDEHHALSYLVQRTSSDIFLRALIKVHKLLERRRSKIIFTVHDSIMIDFASEDLDLLRQLINACKNTVFGGLDIAVNVGYTWGQMERRA